MTASVVSSARVERAARIFAEARASGAGLAAVPADIELASMDEAYAVQDATLQAMDTTAGGWKIGLQLPAGLIQGAPLPATAVHRSGATLARGAFIKPGLELEIAFVLGRSFDARTGPYADDVVLQAIDTVHAAIEVTATRFRDWPNVPKLWQLADLQNNGALIVGEGTAYDSAYPFVAPAISFTFDGASISERTPPANPAGDPRRLLSWAVNHCVSRGLTLSKGTVLTCGSYTGIHFPTGTGVAKGIIEGLAPVQVTLS